MRGRIASLEDRQTAWPYPGRKRMFSARSAPAEGSLRALMLPELPATVRRGAQGLWGKPMTVDLATRDIIRQDVLELHGR